MKRINAVEHGWLSTGPAGDLTSAEADALAGVESLLPRNCLEWGRNRVKFRQYCGVVQLQQKLQIEILPKVFPHQTPHQQRTTLIEMLDTAGTIDRLGTLQAGLSTTEHGLLDIFIGHFLKMLETQLQQGLLRDYRDTQDNLGQVRGRIELVRQLRENLFKPQRIACRFNELVTDIPVNRLLHSALQCLAGLAHDHALRQKIQRLRLHFTDIGTLGQGEYQPGANDLNRMQRRYAASVEFARMVLQGQYLDARAGSRQMYSLLFDMNLLFERFVAVKLRPLTRQPGLHIVLQGPRTYLGRNEKGQGRLLMRPDLSVLDARNRPLLMVDAKWKLLNPDDPLATLASADLYQLAAYASGYGCDHVALAYPEQDRVRGHYRITLQLQRPVTLTVLAVPLTNRVSDLRALIAQLAQQADAPDRARPG